MLHNAPRLASEVGKIRIGDRVPITSGPHKGDPRPNKVDHFILTSNNHLILQAAAKLYGGDVEEWLVPTSWQGKGTAPDHKYRLYTQATILKIVLRATQMMDTSRELWEGGWCVRRCDGAHVYFDAYDKAKCGLPCLCPQDHDARKALAKEGKACQETSRLQVQIYDLPYGYWRLDTKGFYGPAEVRELQDFLTVCGLGYRPIEAMLRLETATARRIVDGKKMTHRFPKVVIEPIYTAAQLAVGPGASPETRPLLLPASQRTLGENVGALYGDDAQNALEQAETDAARQELLGPLGAWLRTLKPVAVRTNAITAIFGEPMTPEAVKQLDEDSLSVALQKITIATQAGLQWNSATLGQDLKTVLQGSAKKGMEDFGYETGIHESAQEALSEAPPTAKETRTTPVEPLPTHKPGERTSEAARGLKRDLQVGPAWETLLAYRGDARLPEDLLQKVDDAFTAMIPLTYGEADTLAGIILDRINQTPADE